MIYTSKKCLTFGVHIKDARGVNLCLLLYLRGYVDIIRNTPKAS